MAKIMYCSSCEYIGPPKKKRGLLIWVLILMILAVTAYLYPYVWLAFVFVFFIMVITNRKMACEYCDGRSLSPATKEQIKSSKELFSIALIKCKVCQKEVSKSAANCPHCNVSAPGLHIKCPKCNSKNISAGKKGFGLVQAATGGLFLGPIGILGGLFRRRKVRLICEVCGKKWKPSLKEIS